MLFVGPLGLHACHAKAVRRLMFTLAWTLEARAAYDELKAKAEASLAARRKRGKEFGGGTPRVPIFLPRVRRLRRRTRGRKIGVHGAFFPDVNVGPNTACGGQEP
jgi:hypothetical protein